MIYKNIDEFVYEKKDVALDERIYDEVYAQVKDQNAYSVLERINNRILNLSKEPNGAIVHAINATQSIINGLFRFYEDALKNNNIEDFVNIADVGDNISLRNALVKAKSVFKMDFEEIGEY